MTDSNRAAAIVGQESAGDNLEALKRKIEDYERWFRTQDNQICVLERERQKFSALTKYTDAGIVLFDSGPRVVWTNESFISRFGERQGSRKDPLGAACHEVLCRRKEPCDGCPAAKMFKQGKVAHHELNLLIDDKFRPVYATATPVHFPDGSIEQSMVMIQDLSELALLRQSEEALRSSEERMRSIFEQARTGMFATKADGSFLQVTASVCRMLGYTEGELLRKKFTDFIHSGDMAQVVSGFKEGASGKRNALELEFRMVRRDLTPVWCQLTAVWQFDSGTSKAKYCVSIVQDISERKRAEHALEQSQRRYQELVHSIDGIVWEADPKIFRFQFVSKQAERILGHPVERWMSHPRFWRNQIHPEDLEVVLKQQSEAVEARRDYEMEYRMVSTDGNTIWIRDSVRLLLDGDRVTKLRGLMVDITEKKAAEQALRASEEQLRQSQKMEAIGRLAGGIAHDFNNLLTAITGYGELLLKGLGDNPLRREALEISKAAVRAADLTGQLLAFSRQQVLQPQVLVLNDVIADMEMMMQRVIGEHIEFRTNLAGSLGAVKADPGQMHQVLLNLAVNARDAMLGGGALEIVTEDIDLGEDQPLPDQAVVPGRYIRLTVRDTGCGMDDETKTRLFEPFFTTKEQGKGTGLGLSTVYGIVKQSGGHIVVRSVLGQGTTFEIYLPRVDDQLVQPMRRTQEALPDTSPGTEKILLVEDDDSVRELAREVLEMNGYEVVEASNGVEALSVFEQQSETIDLMVTDLVMPQMGGRDLAEKIAPISPELRVLYLSGYTDSVAMQQGILDPGSYFLQKPFTPAALAHKVREALDS